MIRGTSEQRDTTTWGPDDDMVAKAASTRLVPLATGEMVRFTRDALESIIEHVERGFVPMTLEHLTFLPPVGRWHSGELVMAEDGADELILRGRYLTRLRPVDADPDLWRFLDARTEGAPAPPESVEIEHVGFAPRIFDDAAVERAKASAPVPVEEEERWSVLPPIEWVIAIQVTWALTRFVGSFLDTLGRETAESLVRWLRELSAGAKDSERDRIVTLRFVLPDETYVYGFIPVAADNELDVHVLPALDSAGRVAEIAGAQAAREILGECRQAAFLWKDGAWHLAWSVLSDDTVRVTNWFLANEPDPTRFLGRPLLPEGE
jgi:hypothetical protein